MIANTKSSMTLAQLDEALWRRGLSMRTNYFQREWQVLLVHSNDYRTTGDGRSLEAAVESALAAFDKACR